MAVTEDRKYTGEHVFKLLEGVKGKTLGEVDKSHQFERARNNPKITGIAGNVIEQSVFGYDPDSDQECDMQIDGILTELKTTGVRIPKSDYNKVQGLVGKAYNAYLKAKEGISITGVTFEPDIQREFYKSHFWEKLQRLLIVFYEYQSYEVVLAYEYRNFPILGYCLNTFSDVEQKQLRSDWEIVRDYLSKVYAQFPIKEDREEYLVGFTHILRPNLLLIELVPGYKNKPRQRPRYRLKKTFVDYIVQGHFNESRKHTEIDLSQSFSSFKELDQRCHDLTQKYKGKTFVELKEMLNLDTEIKTKDFGARCILSMFDANCSQLNQISDFTKAGIIAKTIKVTPKGNRTEDMKLQRIDFDEWANRNIDFEESNVYTYFCEHSFLCPIFCEHVHKNPAKTTFEGFKRFAFDDTFIEKEVKRTWEDSRDLIFSGRLTWKYELDKEGNKKLNKTGTYSGAPNFPKSSEYKVFFRGGATDSREESFTEAVNGIKMLPQFFWLKGSFIADKLKSIDYL